MYSIYRCWIKYSGIKLIILWYHSKMKFSNSLQRKFFFSTNHRWCLIVSLRHTFSQDVVTEQNYYNTFSFLILIIFSNFRDHKSFKNSKKILIWSNYFVNTGNSELFDFYVLISFIFQNKCKSYTNAIRKTLFFTSYVEKQKSVFYKTISFKFQCAFF